MIVGRRAFLKQGVSAAIAAPAMSRLRFASAAVAAVSQSQMAADPQRPQYHLLPPANWMNDPNGPIYWKRQYHMFYQYNPDGAFWGDMHWGHAVSPDMVHWKHIPVALSPTPGGPDADGCFSGTAVVQDGRVAMLYTGVRSVPASDATNKGDPHSFRESQCLAYSSDADLRSWTKLPDPVIAAPPADLAITGFRDPAPWTNGEDWLMAVGSGFPDRGGAVLLYKSKDLHHWEYLHPLVVSNTPGNGTGNPVDSGDMWECPDFFPLGNKHVLIYSTQGKSFWKTGNFDLDTLTFHPEKSGLVDTGPVYAAKSQLDSSGNRILWGWVQETRPADEYRAAGWACLMSLPRILSLGNDGQLRMDVAPQLHQLRRAEQRLATLGSEGRRLKQLNQMKIEGACGEISCSVRTGSAPFSLLLYGDGETSGGSGSCLSLRFDPTDPAQIKVDDYAIPIAPHTAVELNIYVDSSVIELIVNHSAVHTKRFYYPGTAAPSIRLKWSGSARNVESLSLWQLSPISANRLTT